MLCTLLLLLPTNIQAQEANPQPDKGQGKTDTTNTDSAKARAFPRDPLTRLKRAKEAYQKAEYQLLRPLLLPVLEPKMLLTTSTQRIEARTLLGVGAYFEAQAAKDATTRDKLNQLTREQFLAILREKPTHALDSLVYPVSIIDVFESVRKLNKAELDQLIAKANNTNPENPNDLQTIYIERSITEQVFAINFLPFGLGQFQNEHNVKGTIFATIQAASLILNVISYFNIEARRNSTGQFNTDGGDNSDFAQALVWQQVYFSSLGVFAGVYTWSVIDGIYYYRDTKFRYLRTLDKPPNELRPRNAPPSPSLQLNWSWQF